MLEGLVDEGGEVPASLLGAHALLPRVPTELCCHGSICRVLTSTSAAPSSIFVSCLCADCTVRRPDLLHRDGGSVLSLDRWIEHVSGVACGAGDLATALDLVAVRQQQQQRQQQAAAEAAAEPLVPLRSWLRAASAHMGGAALMRRQVSIYWFCIDSDDNEPGLPPPPSQRQAAAAVAAAGPKQPAGAWRAASVVSYDPNTTVWTIKYHTDSKRHHSTVLLPLCGVHFSRTPPAPGAQLRSMPEGVPPLPAFLPPPLPSAPVALQLPAAVPPITAAAAAAVPRPFVPQQQMALQQHQTHPQQQQQEQQQLVPIFQEVPMQLQEQQAHEAHPAHHGSSSSSWLRQQGQQQQELQLPPAMHDASDALSEAGEPHWIRAGNTRAVESLPPATGAAAGPVARPFAVEEACAAAVTAAQYTAAAITAVVSPWQTSAEHRIHMQQQQQQQPLSPPAPGPVAPVIVPVMAALPNIRAAQQPPPPQQTAAEALVWSTTEALRQAALLSAVSSRPAVAQALSPDVAGGSGGLGPAALAAATPAAASTAAAMGLDYSGGGALASAPLMLPISAAAAAPAAAVAAPPPRQVLPEQPGQVVMGVFGTAGGGSSPWAAMAAAPGLPPGHMTFGGLSGASAPPEGGQATAAPQNFSNLPAFAQSSPGLLTSTAVPATTAGALTPCGPASSLIRLDDLQNLRMAPLVATAAGAEAAGEAGTMPEPNTEAWIEAEALRAVASLGPSGGRGGARGVTGEAAAAAAGVAAGAVAAGGGAVTLVGPPPGLQAAAPYMQLRPASRNSSSSSSNNNGQQQLLAAQLFAPLPAFAPALPQLPQLLQMPPQQAHPQMAQSPLQQQTAEPHLLVPQQPTIWQHQSYNTNPLQEMQQGGAVPLPPWAMVPAAGAPLQLPFAGVAAAGGLALAANAQQPAGVGAPWLAAPVPSPQPRPEQRQEQLPQLPQLPQQPQLTLARLPSNVSALMADVPIPPAVRPRTASYGAAGGAGGGGGGMTRAASFNVLVGATTTAGTVGTVAGAAAGSGVRAARTTYNTSGAMAPALAPLAAHLRSPQRPRLMAAGRGAVRPVASIDHGGPTATTATGAADPPTPWGGGGTGVDGDGEGAAAGDGSGGVQQQAPDAGDAGGGGGGDGGAGGPPEPASSDHGSAGRAAAARGPGSGGASGSLVGLSILTAQWAQEAAAAAAAAATAAAVAALAAVPDASAGGSSDAGVSMFERMHAVASAAAAAASNATRRTEDGGGGNTSDNGAAAAAAAGAPSSAGGSATRLAPVVPPGAPPSSAFGSAAARAAGATSLVGDVVAPNVRMSASVRPDIERGSAGIAEAEQEVEAAAAVARWSAPAGSVGSDSRRRSSRSGDAEAAAAAADDLATAAAAATTSSSSALALGFAGVTAGGRTGVRLRSVSGGGRRSRSLSLRAASPSQQQASMLSGSQAAAAAAARSSAGTSGDEQHDDGGGGDTRSSLATVIDGDSDDEADELLQQLLQPQQRTSTGATSAGRRLAGGGRGGGGNVAAGGSVSAAAHHQPAPATSAVLGLARCGPFGAAGGPSLAAGGGVDSSSRRSGALVAMGATEGQQAEGLLGKRTRPDLGSGPHGSAAASSTALHTSLGAAAPALLFGTAAAPPSFAGAASMVSAASAGQFTHQTLPPHQQPQNPAPQQLLPTVQTAQPGMWRGSAPALPPVDVQAAVSLPGQWQLSPLLAAEQDARAAATAPSRMSWESPGLSAAGPMSASPFSTAAAGGGSGVEGAQPAVAAPSVEHSGLYAGAIAAPLPWGGSAYGPAVGLAAAASASTASAVAFGGSSTLWGDESTGQVHRIQSMEHPAIQSLHLYTSAPLPTVSQHATLQAAVAGNAAGPVVQQQQQQQAQLYGTAAVATGASSFPALQPRGAMSPQMSAHHPLPPQTQFLVGLGGGLGSPGMGTAASTGGGGSDGSSGGLSLTRLVPMSPGPAGGGLNPQQQA